MRFKSSFLNILLFGVLISSFGLLNSSFAQFSVVSVSPTHGSTNVDTLANITMVFNAPLDTTAHFSNPEGFFINLYLYPDSLIGDPDTLIISPDLTTVNVNGLSLVDNTTYLFVIVNAVSQSGDSLDIPYSFVFTTGGSLPTATVSGNISYPGSDPTGAVVALMDNNPFGDNETNAVNGAVIPSAIGTYTVDYVKAGIYWPIAIQNFVIDEYGELELKPGSAVGMYDPNSDEIPDSIVVTSGAIISNIDMTLFESFPQTARNPFPNIEALAQAWSSDAYPVQIGGGTVEPDGSSLFWQFAFYSPSLMQYRGWMAIGDLIAVITPDSVESTTPLPLNWLDSDAIMNITEANGGSQFRQEYSDADVSAFLVELSFGDDESVSRSSNSDSRLQRNLFPKVGKILPLKEADFGENEFDQFTEFPTVWGVQYYSDSIGAELFFIIDAVTGVVLNQPTTAAMAEVEAFQLAKNWAADAKLWSVGNHAGGGSFVDSLGKTLSWAYFYYSPSLDSLHLVISWGQLPFFEGPAGTTSDTITIPLGWLDSDTCIAVAEAAGGAAYRANNQNVLVYASLSRWFFGPNPELTIWEFRYTSSNAPSLRINVDAFSGNIITEINKPDSHNLPDQFTLHQNYPNPFNPETHIEYALPHSERVTIKVFDLLGKEVTTLVDKYQPAGYYGATFDGSHLASGIYFYQIKAEAFMQTRKMLLAK